MARRARTSSGGKAALIIFAIIIFGLLIFCAYWTINNWSKVKEGLDGANIYTAEDLEKAKEEAYKQGLSDKSQIEDMLDEKNTLIRELKGKITALENKNSKLEQNNQIYYSQIQSNYERIEELNENAAVNAEEIARLNQVNVDLLDAIHENKNIISAQKITIATYEKGLNGLIVDGVSIVTFNIDGAIVDFEILLNGEKVSIDIPQSTDDYVINGWTVNNEVVDINTYEVNENTCFTADITKYHTVTFYDIDGNVRGTSRQLAGEAFTMPEYFANMNLNSIEYPDGFYIEEKNTWATNLAAVAANIDRDLSLYAFYSLPVTLHYNSTTTDQASVTYCYQDMGYSFSPQQLQMDWGYLNPGEDLDWNNIFNITTRVNLREFDYLRHYDETARNVVLYRLSYSDLIKIDLCTTWDADGNPIEPDGGKWVDGVKVREKGLTIYSQKGQRLVGITDTLRKNGVKLPDAFVGWDSEGNYTFIPSSDLNNYSVTEDMSFVAVYAMQLEFVFAEDDIVKTNDDEMCLAYISAHHYFNPVYPSADADRINNASWSFTEGGSAIDFETADWYSEFKKALEPDAEGNPGTGIVTLYLVK